MTKQEALRELEFLVSCSYVDRFEPTEKEALKMAIKALEQEPKTGHWKRIGYDIYECSICGQNVMTGDICAYRHCHCCGANMRSEDKK